MERLTASRGARILADGTTCVGFADRGSVQSDRCLVPSRFGFLSAASYFEAKVTYHTEGSPSFKDSSSTMCESLLGVEKHKVVKIGNVLCR
jgi:hypothetical protein